MRRKAARRPSPRLGLERGGGRGAPRSGGSSPRSPAEAGGAFSANPFRLTPPLGVLLEGLKLRTPELFHLVEPLAKLAERFAPKSVDSHPSVVLLFVLGDQTRFSKDAKVPAERRSTHRQRFGKLSGTPGL